MKFLIVGRTATGKDTLASILIYKYKWKFVKSMATRPKRYDDEDTHVFISEEQANAIPLEDRVAYTKIGDYQYFATKEQVQESDAYIIDPNGVKVILEKMPEENFIIVYIRPVDRDIQKLNGTNRVDNTEHESKVFEKRYNAEDAQFTEFEDLLDSYRIYNYKNVKDAIQHVNNYDMDSMEYFAHILNIIKNYSK